MTRTFFELQNPWWLLLLLVIPLMAWWRGRRGRGPAVVFGALREMPRSWRGNRNRRGFMLASFLYPGIALLALAMARPLNVTSTTVARNSGIDIMIVLDVSRSMLAEDFTIGGRRANRLEAVKQVTDQFIAERQADRMGLIAFAGRPYLVSPLTLDHSWLQRNLRRVRIGLVEDGTAIGSAIATAARRLESSDAPSRVIVLLTDGENNSGKISPPDAADAAAALGLKIYTIGAGSPGPIALPFTLRSGQPIFVEYDEDSLREIATRAGGRYYQASDAETLARIYDEIDRLERHEIETDEVREVDELYQIPLSIGLSMVLLQVLLSLTAFRLTP